MKRTIIFLILILSCMPHVPVEGKETESITFQPSEMANIGFDYDPSEYTFDLTWKDYYLTLRPFAIYEGETYTLKKIIPFLKSNYPDIRYRPIVKRLKNFDRWGFYLEKLPQDIADKLDYLGFQMTDTNIPLAKFDIEEIKDENFTFKRLHVGKRFTLDFYDLYERGFSVEVTKKGILIGNVRGKTDLDLDPITYSSPHITVTGFTQGEPCTFFDLWNASNFFGWNVSSQICENISKPTGLLNNSYSFSCKILIGDGSTETHFNDDKKQIYFESVFVYRDILINVKANARFTLGDEHNPTLKIGTNGVTIVSLVDTGHEIINSANAYSIYLYACSFYTYRKNVYVDLGGCTRVRIWQGLFDHPYIRCSQYTDSIYETTLIMGDRGISNSRTNDTDRIQIYKSAYGIYASLTSTFKNIFMRGCSNVFRAYALIQGEEVYLINIDSDTWKTNWGGSTGGELYRQYTFNLEIVDNVGTPNEGVTVTLTYEGQGGGTVGPFSTFPNGTIPEQTLTKGFYNYTGGDTIFPYEPYTLTITKEGYIDYSVSFNISAPISWTVGLEPLDVIFSMELLVLAAVSMIFMLMMLFSSQPGMGVISGTLAFMFWFATGMYYMYTNIADQYAIGYLFIGLGLICGIFTIYCGLKTLDPKRASKDSDFL